MKNKLSLKTIVLFIVSFMITSAAMAQQPRPGSGWAHLGPTGTPNGQNVVLVAGLMGWVDTNNGHAFPAENYLVTGGIAGMFQASGYDVYVVNIPEGAHTQRGQDLGILMNKISNDAVANGRENEFVMFGHSQGGLIIQDYYLNHCPNTDIISQIITSATPFNGSAGGDAFLELLNNDAYNAYLLVQVWAEMYGITLTDITSHYVQDLMNSIVSLSVANCTNFQEVMQGNVNYASFLEKLYSIVCTTSAPEDFRFKIIAALLGTELYGEGLGDGIVLIDSQCLSGSADCDSVTADHSQGATTLVWTWIKKFLMAKQKVVEDIDAEGSGMKMTADGKEATEAIDTDASEFDYLYAFGYTDEEIAGLKGEDLIMAGELPPGWKEVDPDKWLDEWCGIPGYDCTFRPNTPYWIYTCYEERENKCFEFKYNNGKCRRLICYGACVGNKMTVDLVVNVCEVSSMKEHNTGEIHVYPNPASTVINVSGASSGEATERIVTITDMSGKEVGTTTLTATDTSVPVKDLPSGIYMIIVIEDGVYYNTKFVIQR